MNLLLLFLHTLSVGIFLGVTLLQFALLTFQPLHSSTWQSVVFSFYFFSLPFFLLFFLSGVLLVVYRDYRFREELWLKRKMALALAIMFIFVIFFFPELKGVALFSQNGVWSHKFPPLLLNLLLLLVIGFLAIAQHISLSHRKTLLR